MAVYIKIESCRSCPQADHSGAFTPGGARLTCRFPGNDKEPKQAALPGEAPVDTFIRLGFAPEHAEKLAKDLREDKNVIGKWHWINRLRPADGSIPEWCPLKAEGE